MNAPLARVLAVDIGTSSVRAMVYDAAGTIHARSQIAYSTVCPALYFEEQDPAWVRDEVFRAIALCLAQPGAEPARIAAIGFSSQLYGVIALDADDRLLTWNILWADGRAEAQAEAIKQEFGAQWLYPETGCPMNSIFPFAKIAWLRDEAPEIFGAARRFVSIKEYVTHPLIGEWAVDYSMASSTGLFDIRERQWSAKATDYLGIDAQLLSAPVSGIHRFSLQPGSPLADLGLPENLAVFLGGGDGPLANLGAGAAALGTINIDLGTSGAARCLASSPLVDDTASLWCFCLTDDLWVSGGIVTNVGNAYQWFISQVRGDAKSVEREAYDAMNQAAAEIVPGSDGLYFVPYLRKARSPYWDGRLKGTMYGLTARHTAGHMVRALFEAIAFDLRTIYGVLHRNIALASHVVLTGGLSRSRIIPQLVADVLDREVRVPEDGEGSIAGAAILALQGLGEIDGLAFSGGPRASTCFLPDTENPKRYEPVYQGYTRLIEVLREISL
ncbi:MAG: gluconokinase [Candidatus Accumulibacter sp.]|jgi:gluconokinase|nr:gluconokinase [Accumulibacter sp.]